MFPNILSISRIGKAKVEESTPVIRAYLNPYCPWSPGVRSVLDCAGLDYEILDIAQDRRAFEEMVAKSRAPIVWRCEEVRDYGADKSDEWTNCKDA